MRILIVDFDAVFRTLWHSKAGDEAGAAHEYTIGKIRKVAHDFDRVAIACDSRTSRRKKLEPSYKASRKPIEPACVEQMTRARETLALDGFPIFESEGEEGDDVIASFCAWFDCDDADDRFGPDDTVTIFGADKDLVQCLAPNIDFLHQTEMTRLTITDVPLRFGGVTVEQWIDYQTLCGDSVDDVKGVTGVAGKRAAALLKRFGSVSRITKAALDASIPDADFTGPAIRKAIVEALPWLDMTRELVTLRSDIDLPFESVLAERVAKPIPSRYVQCFTCNEELTEEETYESTIDGNVYCLKHARDMRDAVVAADARAEALKARGIVEHKGIDGVVHVDETGEHVYVAQPVDSVGPARTTPEGAEHATSDAVAPASPPVDPAPRNAAADTGRPSVAPSREPLAITKGQLVAVARAEDSRPTIMDRSDPRWAMALEPRDSGGALSFAKHMLASRLFAAYGNEDQILAVVMMGRSFGLDSMTSLRGFHLIKNKVAMSAQLMAGLVMSSGKSDYFDPVESSAEKATYVTRRKGSTREFAMTYTIQQAAQARLCRIDNGNVIARSDRGEPLNWEKDPASMCIARATSRLCRAVYPDVIGNTYTPDEVEEFDK